MALDPRLQTMGAVGFRPIESVARVGRDVTMPIRHGGFGQYRKQELPGQVNPLVGPAVGQPAPMTITKPGFAPQPVDMTRVLTKPAPIQSFQHGGLVEEEPRTRLEDRERVSPTTRVGALGSRPDTRADGPVTTLPGRETTITKSPPAVDPGLTLGSPKTPTREVKKTKDQSRLGGEFTEAHRAALEAGIRKMAEEGKLPQAEQPQAGLQGTSPTYKLQGAVGAPAGPDQGGQVQRQWLGIQPMTVAEFEEATNAVDPDHKLPGYLRNLKALAFGYKYYSDIGNNDKAKEYAVSFLQHARLHAAAYGEAAGQAAQDGNFEDAKRLIEKGHNEFVPDGYTLLNRKNGMIVMRDLNGKVVASFNPTPQDIAAAALSLKNGQAFWDGITRAAGEAMTEAEAGTAKRGEARLKASDRNARLKLNKYYKGQSETEEGEPGPNLVEQSLLEGPLKGTAAASDPLSGDMDPEAVKAAEAKTAQAIKTLREPIQHVATELVMGSDGALSPEAALEVATKLAAVDPDNPERSPFQARLDRNKKTKVPVSLSLLIDGEVYKLPHQSLKQVKQIVKWHTKQVEDLAKKRETDKAAAEAEAKRIEEHNKNVKERNAGFSAAAETADRVFNEAAVATGKAVAGTRQVKQLKKAAGEIGRAVVEAPEDIRRASKAGGQALQELADILGPQISAGASSAAGAIGSVPERVRTGAKTAGTAIQELADRVGPQVTAVIERYGPQIRAQLGRLPERLADTYRRRLKSAVENSPEAVMDVIRNLAQEARTMESSGRPFTAGPPTR